MTVYAALDCGTNSTRLLIADSEGLTLRREMRVTRLGQGVDATGQLALEALERTYNVLSDYGELMREFEVTRAQLVATSAARDAMNGAEFLERAAQITGAKVALLSGSDEAALSYRGATANLKADTAPTMIVDIGGGSTELAVEVNGHLVGFSMQVGCVRVTERALGVGRVNVHGAEQAQLMIDLALDQALTAVPEFAQLTGRIRLLGLAGTVSTLAQMDAGLSVYDREAVHLRRLSLDDVVHWRKTLGAELPVERLKHAGMEPGRQDVIVGGIFILETVMRRFRIDELLCSESDILDGIVSRMMESPTW